VSSLFDWAHLAAIVVAAVLAAGGYVLSRSAASWLRRRGAHPLAVRAVRTVIALIGLALAAAVLFSVFGPVSIVSGLTLSAVVGLGFTLALQTTIGNVIAGYILLRDRLLRLNDDLQISGVRGKVVQVGLVTTWLRLEDGSVASVSNSTLLGGPLINRTAGERLKGEY
jgi:small-conductance mechanosensitive channel